MAKRLFSLSLMIILATTAWANIYNVPVTYNYNLAPTEDNKNFKSETTVTVAESTLNIHNIHDGRFASSGDTEKLYYRKSNNGFFAQKGNFGYFSILDLKEGDKITITCTDVTGESPYHALNFKSTNAYLSTDENKTAVEVDSKVTTDATYVITSAGRLDLYLGSSSGNVAITNIVIETTVLSDFSTPTNQLTFDFAGNDGQSLSWSDNTVSLNAHASSTTSRDFNYVIPYSNKITPYGFFLVVKPSSGSSYSFNSAKGLRITTDYFAINNLKAGDIIKVTQDVYTDNTSLVITNSTNEATNVIYTIDGSNLTKVAQNSTIASGEEFLVGKDGYVTFNINKGTVIKTIEITTSTTSTDETIAAPSITVDNTTARITPTTASNGSFTTTYFTTDGTPPNSESTAYTEPFNIDNSQGDVTIKAITYINGLSNKSDIASTVIEAASFDITVNQTTGGTFTVKVGDADVTDASTTAKYGQIITLDNTPAENYTFTTYSVTKTSGGEAVEVTNGSFTMPAEAVTVTAVFSSTATTLTSDNVSVAPVTYNGTEQTAVVKYNTTTLIKNTDYTITGTDALTNAGSTTFSITGTGSYSGIVEKTFTINKATLSATADDKSKTVGEENPELTVTVEGFVNEETSESLTTAGTYTAPTASTEATTESPAGEYAITVSGGSATNYNFSYVPGTLTILALAPSNPTLTIATELTGGSIAATPSGEVASGTSVTLTATPAAGYQLKNWKSGDDVCGDLPKSLVQTISMPENDLSITAEFEAQPETVPSISTSTLWTFDSFTPNTILSDKATYYYNGLYISGHNNGTPSNMATIKSGAKSTTIDEESVSVSNCLYLAGGNTTSRSSQEVNVFALDRVAFYTSVPGTVYVYMSGTKDSSRNFIIEANGTQNTTAMSANDTNPVLLTQTITAASKVYIGTSNGSCNIYAIKFVPTPIPSSYDITVTQPELGGTVGVKVGDAEVTTANTTATAGQTITLSNTPADNFTFTSYSVTKTSGGAAVEVTDGSFTMPAEGVTVTAVFEPTAHVHNFNYAVGTGDNTNILIATCQNPSCNLTDNKATLALTADGGTYNGSAFSATTDVDAFNVATGLSATVSINYTGDNSYNSTDAPTNAGTYIATATVTIGDTNYTLNKSFTIAKASITELTITELDAPVKGMALDTEVACSTTGIESASVVWKKGETDATGNAEASTVYTAIVTLTASSNYVFAESPTVNAISEKAGAVTRNNDTQISVAYTFDATEAEASTYTVTMGDHKYGPLSVSCISEGQTTGQATAGSAITVMAGEATTAGYTVSRVKVVETGTTTEVTVTDNTFTMPSNNVTVSVVYTKVDLSVTPNITSEGGSLAFTSSNNPNTKFQIGNTVTITISPDDGYRLKANTLAATYNTDQTLSLTKGSDTQYTFTMPGYDVTVAAEFELEPQAISVTANDYSGTFDGAAHGITVTAEGATITYRTTDSGDYTLTDNPTYTNVGTYTVYYKVSKAGSDDIEGSKTVTITQKDLNITAKPQTITQGESISTGVNQVEVSGLVDGDALTAITLTPSTVEVTTTGTITPSAAETTKGATNYNITYVEGNLTITNSAPVTHTLTVNVDDASHGSVTIIVAGEAASSGVAVAEGASVSVTATANDGYELDALTVNGTAVDATNITESPEKTYTYSLVMPAEATVIAASFSAIANQELSASVAIDFQDAAEAEENLTFATEKTDVWEYADENNPDKKRSDYYLLTNNSSNLPINGKLSWRDPKGSKPILESTGIKSNGYPFAIHNLVKNDEIIIVHSGTLTNVTATSGNTFSIGETAIEANGTITSGSTIKVTSVGTHNSIVLKPGNNTVISAIYINHEVVVKPEKVSAPTIALRSGFTNRVTITSGVSSYGNNVTTYYTTDGTEPTTESTSFTENSKNLGPYTQEVTIKAVSISETGLASAITSFVLDPQKFTITLPSDLEGGAVTANKETATEGETVKLTITPADGYYLAQLIADNGVTIDVNNNFKMPAANVTISATFVKKTAENANAIVTEDVKVVDETHATITSVEPESLTETTTVAVSGTVNNVPVTAIENGAFASLQGSNVQSVDLSSTQVALEGERSTNSVLKDIPENTLVYLPCTSSNVTGNNVIIYDGEGTAASDYTCNNFVMTDTKSYSVPQPFTATNATLSRSFTSGVTCTVCLPYDVPAGNLDGNIYQFSEVNGTTVKMTQKEGGLVANTPYIFVPSGNVTQITATSVTINMSGTPNTSPDGQSFTFKGVFEHKDFTTDEISDGIYGFAADANHGALSVGQFVKASNGAWTEGMRAYLAYSGSLSETEVASTRGEGLPDVLNVVLIHANGSTTNIGSLELMTADDGSPVYNLNGQRVDNSYKGLVIKNGKKVVKK